MEERIRRIFSESLDIRLEDIVDELEYNSRKEWDSVGHMALIAALEEEFDIMLETDDIIDMSSFRVAKEILRKYGLEV